MKKVKAATQAKPVTDDPIDDLIEDPEDAASLAACRLNAVLALLQTETNKSGHDKPEDDDGGYIVYTAMDLIREIRDYLRKSVTVASAKRERETAGGAR